MHGRKVLSTQLWLSRNGRLGFDMDGWLRSAARWLPRRAAPSVNLNPAVGPSTRRGQALPSRARLLGALWEPATSLLLLIVATHWR